MSEMVRVQARGRRLMLFWGDCGQVQPRRILTWRSGTRDSPITEPVIGPVEVGSGSAGDTLCVAPRRLVTKRPTFCDECVGPVDARAKGRTREQCCTVHTWMGLGKAHRFSICETFWFSDCCELDKVPSLSSTHSTFRSQVLKRHSLRETQPQSVQPQHPHLLPFSFTMFPS
jgi:hypothetical protein